jgi:thermitase
MKKKIITITITIILLLTTVPTTFGFKLQNKENVDTSNKNVKGYNLEPISCKNNLNILRSEASFQNFVPGELVVKLKDDAMINSVDVLNDKFGMISFQKVFKEANDLPFCNIFKLSFSSEADILDLVEEYNKDPNIEYAEPNYFGFFDDAVFPNDPMFDDQWSLHNIGQNNGRIDADIDAPEAWNITTGDSDVIIAILDTGIDLEHPDLKDKIIDAYDATGHENPKDEIGHGTHCAGIAAAMTDNSVGISGVGCGCNIMSVKVLDEIDLPEFTPEFIFYFVQNTCLADGIYHVVNNFKNRPKVISMSFHLFHDSKLVNNAINYANNNNVVLVASAGNEFTSAIFSGNIAGYDNVISVAATDNNDENAFFTNYGSWVDVAATLITLS